MYSRCAKPWPMKALDEVFGLLDRERRRYALYYRQEAGGPVPVNELAEQIAARENEPPTAAVPDDAFDDVTLTLRHHLPKAVRTEYIEYDPEAGVVRLSGTSAEFDVVPSVAKAIEQPANETRFSLRDLV